MDEAIHSNPASSADTPATASSIQGKDPSGNIHDPIERDYRAVHDALTAKPAVLHAILDQTRHKADRDFETSLTSGTPYSPDDIHRHAQAEKQYQKSLEKNADQVFEQFKRLPIDRKIELLIEAEKIGDRNDKARAQTRVRMQAAHTEALAAHHAAQKADKSAPPPTPTPQRCQALLRGSSP